MDKLIHQSTYGLSSDPLAQFAVVFAALVHDVDHPGVSNEQLQSEKAAIAVKYRYKSSAEQHAINTAWELLHHSTFASLRSAVLACDHDSQRFRQMLVNTVMATDLVDDELIQARENRWQQAFHGQRRNPARQTTCVMEHLVLLASLSYAVQGWQTFCKWNERLYLENHRAFVAGRGLHDPTRSWITTNRIFFVEVVVPLTKRLKECAVFGGAAETFLVRATENKLKWKAFGNEICAEMVGKRVKGIGF